MARAIERSIVLLFILVRYATCHSVDGHKSEYRNNRIHQSANYEDVSNGPAPGNDVITTAMATSNIVDSMRDSSRNDRAIEDELFAIRTGRALLQSNTKVSECGSRENIHNGSFSPYDYSIVCGMLIISLGIGVFYGYFHKSSSEASSSDFLLGSGMTLIPVTLSLTTSFITAIELLGNPSEMFYRGTQFCFIVLPMILVIPVAVKIFYPIYFKLELTSCYEYLGIRFGKDIRILGALLYIIQMSFYTAVAVLAPAIALSKATGLNTRLAVVLIYLVCIFYSSQGGMNAVVIADTFQACVLAASLVVLVILGHLYTGGLWQIYETASQDNRLEFFNFDINPTTRHTVWSVVIGGFFYWTSLFCTNQASVQKCMSLKSLKLAKMALGLAILGLIVVFLINFHVGLIVYTKYSNCDPLSFGRIQARDQLLPFFVMDVFKEIQTITGIFVAGIFAASLGTVASALNSMSAVTFEDLLDNGFNIKIHPSKGAMYAKWMSLGFGIVSFLLVFVVELLGGVLQATLTLNGLVGGVTLGLFVLGIAFKKANSKGAFYGGVISLVLVIYIGIMAQIADVEPEDLPLSTANCSCIKNSTGINSEGRPTDATNSLYDKFDDEMSFEGYGFSSIYRVSYMWYSAIGTILTIFFGVLISIVSDIITKHRVLKITRKQRKETGNGTIITVGQDNCYSDGRGHITRPQKTFTEKPNFNEKISSTGIDNLARQIDDEK